MNETKEHNLTTANGAHASNGFKSCPLCGYKWQSLEDLVKDMALRVNGYQACFEKAEDGLFLLTHECPNCHSTLAVKATDFLDWRPCHVTDHLNALHETCPRHCLDKNNLSPCSAECSMRWVRDVLQFLKAHEMPELHDNVGSTPLDGENKPN